MRTRWLGLLLVAVAALTFAGASPAHAVDGFTQPVYHGTPVIHQTEACSGINNTCYRWVRQGGTFMQGPYSQVVHESALTYEVCSYGSTVVDPYTHVRWWSWHLLKDDPVGSFCFVINSVTQTYWSISQWPYNG